MKTKMITIEELRELKPSLSNPIKLVCDDGYFINGMREITVIGIANKSINFISSNGHASNCGEHYLKHYSSFKEEEDKFVEFIEHVDEFGDVRYLTKNKHNEAYLDESCEDFQIFREYRPLPNGRSYKLNLTTGERV